MRPIQFFQIIWTSGRHVCRGCVQSQALILAWSCWLLQSLSVLVSKQQSCQNNSSTMHALTLESRKDLLWESDHSMHVKRLPQPYRYTMYLFILREAVMDYKLKPACQCPTDEVMHLTAGRTEAAQKVNRQNSWPPLVDNEASSAMQMAGALQHLHARGIAHMDVKADNIYESEDGTFKLGDFGLATSLWGRKSTAVQEGDARWAICSS